MANTEIIYQKFDIYNKKAGEAQKAGDLASAKRYYLLAAEQMFLLAKENKGELQKSMFARAQRIIEIAENLAVQKPQSSAQAEEHTSSAVVSKPEKISLEEALAKLNDLVGLDSVKKTVKDWIDQITIYKLRKERGLPCFPLSYHMVFTGNPGTGKTTVARIMAQIYCAMGIVSEGHLVEVERSDLIAGYVGQTAPKTQDVIKKSIGGVLFIDEAYSISSGDAFGDECIATLVKGMEDNRDNLAVIVAGYKDEMTNFIATNPGLKSRFTTKLDFEDYDPKELFKIFDGLCRKNSYVLEDMAKIALVKYFEYCYATRQKDFGNGRDVRNLFQNIVTKQSTRLVSSSAYSDSDMALIKLDDLPDFVIDALTPKTPSEQSKPTAPQQPITTPTPQPEPVKEEESMPEDLVLKEGAAFNSEFKFDWDSLPSITFDDVAGLDSVKETVQVKVLLPLKNPDAFEGYVKKSGGGLLLYGPPGTGKTMIAAAIANEIGAKFCSVKPSDLLHQGAGQSEKAVKALFAQARQFPCAVIYFDEMDSISPKNTKSQYAKQLRSEFLSQLQGVESYGKDTGNILFLIAATNKPWDIDSAFIRPGRFGTRVYVGLPDFEARKYIIDSRINKIRKKGKVMVDEFLDTVEVANKTEGFNCSDISNLMDTIEEISIIRGVRTGRKVIEQADFDTALEEIKTTVQREDIEKLMDWKSDNG